MKQEQTLTKSEEEVFDIYWETYNLSRFGIDRAEFHGLVNNSLSLQRQQILEAVEKEINHYMKIEMASAGESFLYPHYIRKGLELSKEIIKNL